MYSPSGLVQDYPRWVRCSGGRPTPAGGEESQRELESAIRECECKVRLFASALSVPYQTSATKFRLHVARAILFFGVYSNSEVPRCYFFCCL
jgi:hypothetical protein